uniref:Major facilitator superfamily (MFS) profile domain-containing protein n=1 Tax=Romanomermis culicivorax TaxID=13658 RepID=A0A915L0C6_ROMCU
MASGSSRIPTPWKAIVKSVPLYANFAAHWAGDWAAYMMLTCIPTFLDNVFQIEMSQLGFLAAVPYIAYFLCINLAGIIADYLRSGKILSTGNTRKLMTAIAFVSQAIFLLAAGYCPCGCQYLVVVFLTLGAGLSGFQYAGVFINYMDIAPPFAGTILGIGNTISCLSGILAPMAMGELTSDGTRQEWLILFWITAIILVAGTVFYVIFAQGEIQEWATMDVVQKMENHETQTSSTNKDSKTRTDSTLTKSFEKSD